MKYIVFLVLLSAALLPASVTAQGIIKSDAIAIVGDTVPTHTPCAFCSEWAWSRTSERLFFYTRPSGPWVRYDQTIEIPPGVLDFSRSGDTLTLVTGDTTYTVVLPPSSGGGSVVDGTTIVSSGDTISVGVVQAANIAAGAVGPTQIASTAVTPGTYTNSTLTVDGDGRLTGAASGANLADSLHWKRDGDLIYAITVPGDTVFLGNKPNSILETSTVTNVPSGGDFSMLKMNGRSFPGGNQGRTIRAVDLVMNNSVANTIMEGIKLRMNNTGTSSRLRNGLDMVMTQTGGASSPIMATLTHEFTTWPSTSQNYTGFLLQNIFPSSTTAARNNVFRGLYVDFVAPGQTNSNNITTSNFYGIQVRMTKSATPMPQERVIGIVLESGPTPHPDHYGVFQSSSVVRNFFGGRVGIGNSSPAYGLDITATGGIRIGRGTTAQRGIGVTGYLGYNTTWTGYDIHNGTTFRRLLDLPDAAPSENASPVYVSGAWTTAAPRTAAGLASAVTTNSVGKVTITIPDQGTTNYAVSLNLRAANGWLTKTENYTATSFVAIIYSDVGVPFEGVTSFDWIIVKH